MYFFKSTVVDPPAFIYMGKDKFENENLIKFGLPTDVWFHVDKLSSAHVYLRLAPGQSWEEIPEELLIDCCQLVKANSIEGCKKTNVGIVYTPWDNLKKTADMVEGQVSFHDKKRVKKTLVEKRINEITNRLNKTKTESFPDIEAEQKAFFEAEAAKVKAEAKAAREAEQAEIARRRKEKEERSYDRLFDEEKMSSNKFEEGVSFQDVEDDFM
mmetsp:Transcript_131146/g.184980  ORF Transcript_131146/g.184980 Transcript_131146/m.184980 type:complete len:213 (+) Transcript_131146:206-844(+)